eukprot:2151980-Alexandrium_andersonii.AAC.1
MRACHALEPRGTGSSLGHCRDRDPRLHPGLSATSRPWCWQWTQTAPTAWTCRALVPGSPEGAAQPRGPRVPAAPSLGGEGRGTSGGLARPRHRHHA